MMHILVDVFYRQYSDIDSICGEQMLESMTMGSREISVLDLAEIPYTNVYTFEFPLEEGEIDIREYAFNLMNKINPNHQPPQGLRSMMVGDYVIIETQTDYSSVWSMELCGSIGWNTIERWGTSFPVEHPGDPS